MTRYSFISPHNRPFFDLFTKIWITLFVFALVFIFFIYFIYGSKIVAQNLNIDNKKQEILHTQEKIESTEVLYKILVKQAQIGDSFNKSNLYMKNSLKNLLDIVAKTDAISLESVEQDENTLKIIGITPTKSMFALLLETPLKSIFDESDTSYYQLKGGGYKFVSINKKFPRSDNER